MTWQNTWKTVSIELSKPVDDLRPQELFDGLRVVFFWKAVALGHAWLANAQLPLCGDQLLAVAAAAIAEGVGDYLFDEAFRSAQPGLPAPLLENASATLTDVAGSKNLASRLSARISQRTYVVRQSSAVTVAICTRERPADLSRCLSSLTELREHPEEILVIDNTPQTGATREVVSRFCGVRYHCEPRPGLSAARNAALSIATSDIVAFTDDDVAVHPEWVARIRACFDDPKVMVATGLVLPAELVTPAQVVFEQSLQFFHQGYRRRCYDSAYFDALRTKGVPVWSIGAGANMAIRRSSYQHGYRFNTSLGPGVFGGCGEDSEFWYRILAGGWSCVYEPSACVFHYHRRELPALKRLIYQYMKGHVAALLLQFAGSKDAGNLRRLFLQLPIEYAILFLRTIATGFALEHRIQLRGLLGCLAGLPFAFLAKPAHSSEISYEPAYRRTNLPGTSASRY
jgi:glycosyltransferase involved in cell wall biosynthesis